MSKIAVVYWSATGNTEAMAAAVAAGAQAAGAEADLLPVQVFSADMVADYDGIAFGCPAMGAEQLEEDEFEPVFNACLPALSGKKVVIFGSYGWGDGEWMRTWEDTCASAGVSLAAEGLAVNGYPDDDSACAALGAALA